MNKDVVENSKKSYAKPQMKVVELKQRTAILQSSDTTSLDVILEDD